MRSRRVISLGLAFVATLACAWLARPAGSDAARPSLELVSPANMLRSARPFRDAIVRRPAAASQAAFTSGVYRTPDGTPVNVRVSRSYAPREEANQALVNFLGWLVHGTELSQAIVYVETPDEIRMRCGESAVACYSPLTESLFLPGEGQDDLPLVHVIAHEYGHHVARNRSNAPWPAEAFGPKRWASRIGVCARTARGSLFPGNEGGRYRLNPGEGWAEAYRRLNERRAAQAPDPLSLAAWPDIGWPVVDRFFIPDAGALALASRDVLDPWRGPTRSTVTGALTTRRTVTRTVRTPLDGVLSVRLSGSARATATVVDARGRVLSRTGRSVSAIVCGQRKTTIVVKPRQAGSFRLTLAVP